LHGNAYKEDAHMNDELKSGWTLEASSGAIYHFEHIATEIAEEMDEAREGLYVLETINWSLAEDEIVHLNRYYAVGLSEAVAIAARIEIASQDVAETLVALRIASDEEEDLFWRVFDHYQTKLPPPLTDQEAGALESDIEE
jgi:hypothetical protein